MLTTASEQAADRIRIASLHGMSRDGWTRYERGGSSHYDVVMPGFKYNLSDVQAAIGLHQLEAIEARLVRRQAIVDRYDEAFDDLPLVRFAGVPDGDRHARHLYPVLIDPQLTGSTRDDVERRLAEEGVSASVHFRALHLHRYYRERFAFREGQFPNAEFISSRELSLPLSASLSDDHIARVIEVFRRAILGDRA